MRARRYLVWSTGGGGLALASSSCLRLYRFFAFFDWCSVQCFSFRVVAFAKSFRPPNAAADAWNGRDGAGGATASTRGV